MGADRSASECVPEHLACEGAEEFLAAASEVSAHRATSRVGCAIGIPTFVSEEITEFGPRLRLPMDITDNPDNPEVLAVVPLPSATERRRREIMLARLLLVAVDMTLAGEPLGLETARDLSKELRHCYPELVDECIDP
jgi:hypothetical protein